MSNQYSIFDDCFWIASPGAVELPRASSWRRGLTPRELYDAMGFPHDYIIDKDVNGNAITRADQVARCGNAVCPAVAEALVRANLPEHCKKKISDMAHLHNVMTS